MGLAQISMTKAEIYCPSDTQPAVLTKLLAVCVCACVRLHMMSVYEYIRTQVLIHSLESSSKCLNGECVI
jgi:hypothetical protein